MFKGKYPGWTQILHHLSNPGMIGSSPVNTNKQWFGGATSGFRQSTCLGEPMEPLEHPVASDQLNEARATGQREAIGMEFGTKTFREFRKLAIQRKTATKHV